MESGNGKDILTWTLVTKVLQGYWSFLTLGYSKQQLRIKIEDHIIDNVHII